MLWSAIIDIAWSDHKLQKCCASEKNGQRTWGADNWKLLKRRLISLEVAPALTNLDGAPGKCHPLRADRAGQFALHLWGAHRLIFIPDHEPVPSLDDGGLDRARVTKILITEVVDYHGR
jgi:plasmid maintenance system killer protein